MGSLLSELDYFGLFGTRQTIVYEGPIEFFVRAAGEVYLDLANIKLEIK